MEIDDRLQAAIDRLKASAALRSVHVDGQVRAREIELVEAKLQPSMPGEVKKVLLAITPSVWKAAFSNESMRLMDNAELEWIGAQDLAKFELLEDDVDSAYFGFAAGIFGDAVCLRCLDAQPGQVVLFDHEGGVCLRLAPNLAEWIERLLAFDGTDYGYMAGEIEKLEPPQQSAVRAYYLRLNPTIDFWIGSGI